MTHNSSGRLLITNNRTLPATKRGHTLTVQQVTVRQQTPQQLNKSSSDNTSVVKHVTVIQHLDRPTNRWQTTHQQFNKSLADNTSTVQVAVRLKFTSTTSHRQTTPQQFNKYSSHKTSTIEKSPSDNTSIVQQVSVRQHLNN